MTGTDQSCINSFDLPKTRTTNMAAAKNWSGEKKVPCQIKNALTTMKYAIGKKIVVVCDFLKKSIVQQLSQINSQIWYIKQIHGRQKTSYYLLPSWRRLRY